MPVEIMEMHYEWKKIQLFNENCMDHMEEWVKDGAFFYLDPPYLPVKRGITYKQKESPTNSGYMEDMSADDHETLIDKILKISSMGAKCMVCSNFEIDETGELMGVADDPYTRLMKNGFRMVIVERRYSTEGSHEHISIDGETIKQKKKPKVEVVYINYHNIRGVWSFFEYMDYKDIFKNN
jgi:site-specific DNA-adenine methylase